MREKPNYPLGLEPAAGITASWSTLKSETAHYCSSAIGKQIVEAGFPKVALIVLIGRYRTCLVH